MLINKVVLARSGDKDALALVLEAMRPVLLKSLGNSLPPNLDQEDVVQETLLVIIEKIERLREPAYFLDWSKRILYNKRKEMIREQKAWLLVPLGDFAHFSSTDDYGSENRSALIECLKQIKQCYRETLFLSLIKDLPVQAVAKVQNIPEGTVRSRLHYGKQLLKNTYRFYEGD
ncbi:MAG: sigW7 [Paenibacillaceae bacterium]|jgi:RNA polymerase sigma-70 factor (ECF subfamily)|nr:sigW7 [Paenibacillaceae bacterium]